MVEEFIDKQEEQELFAEIDKGKWERLNNMQHYGYEFKYGKNQIDKEE